MRTISPLPDQNQNYWQLASIQSAAFGVPSLQFGANLGKSIGPGKALIAICIGNVVLWLVGLKILSLTFQSRKNALENIEQYIGYSRWLGGLALFLAFLFWYPIQIKSHISAIRITLEPYLNLNNVAFDIRSGTVIGLVISLLAIGGIKLIKWFNVIAFPLLIIFLIYAVSNNKSIPTLKFTWNMPRDWLTWGTEFFQAIFATVFITLAGIVNLPTFFRHRRSEDDAIFALPIFLFFTAVIEGLAVFLVNSDSGEFFTKYLNTSLFNTFIIISFLLIAVVCANLVNIYYATAIWEVLIPWFSRAKELALIGMLGTATFIFFQSQIIMSYGESLFTTFIGILGIVALNGYGIKNIIGHRERRWEANINMIYWLIGCVVVIFVQDIKLNYATIAFILGVSSSLFLLWTTLFVEEIVWGVKKIVLKK